MGPGDRLVRRDHHRFRERWGEDLNFREWRSELGTEEGVPRFLVWAILRLQRVFLVCHCLLPRQDLDSKGLLQSPVEELMGPV